MNKRVRKWIGMILVGQSQRCSVLRSLYMWSLLSFLPNSLFQQVFINRPLCVLVNCIIILGTGDGGE